MAHKVLLHFNGPNQSTSIIDDAGGSTWSAIGTAQIKTEAFKFGGASLLLDGSGAHVESTNIGNQLPSSGGWTIDFWVRFLDLSTSRELVHYGKPVDIGGIELYWNATGTRLTLNLSSNGVTNDIAAGVNGIKTSWATNQWYHIAIIRDDDAGKYFVHVDGVKDIEVTSSSQVTSTLGRCRIGQSLAGARNLSAYVDEFHIDDTPLWTGGTTFSPPTQEYTSPKTQFTLPALTAFGYINPGSRFSLPLIDAAAGNYTPIEAAILLPGHLLTAAIPNAVRSTLTIPRHTLAALAARENSGTADVLLPSLDLLSEVITGNALSAAFSITPLSVFSVANPGLRAELPRFRLGSVLVSGGLGESDIWLPLYSISAAGLAYGLLRGDIRLPVVRLQSSAISGRLYSAHIALPPFVISLSGLVGTIGLLGEPLPALKISARGHPAYLYQADLALPVVLVSATGYQQIQEIFRTWVLNTRRNALTEYTNFDFNSYARFNGKIIAAGPNGIYVLDEQDLDDGKKIESVVRSGNLSYGSSFLKRIPRIYVSYASDGPMEFRTITTHDGPRSYLLPANGLGALQLRRVPVGTGPKSVNWQFEIANRDGADFRLNGIVVQPQLLRRRVLT